MAAKKEMVHVLITTTERSVYCGIIDWRDRAKKDGLDVTSKRHVWEYRVLAEDGEKGVYALCTTGPQDGSRVGPAVEGVLNNIHSINRLSEVAIEAFARATW
jgi:hypothetical protein